MISNEDIESFLHGNDPEEFIVAIEFVYASNSIFKIKEIPIIFTDRTKGQSKMSNSIIKEAVFGVIALRIKKLFNRL